jgi:predicted PurR-regulated permease PerM
MDVVGAATLKEKSPDAGSASGDPASELAVWPEMAHNDQSAVDPQLRRDVLLGIIAVAATAHLLYFARSALFPIVLAFVLNLVIKPVTRRVTKWGLSNMASAVVVFSMVGVTLAGFMGAVWGPANSWIVTAPETIQQVRIKLAPLAKPFARLNQASQQVTDLTTLPSEQQKQPQAVQVQQPSITGALLNTTGGMVATLSTTLVLLFFLMAAGDRFLEKLVGVMPTLADKKMCVQISRQVEQRVSQYLLAITAINIGLGVAVGFGLALLGMPNPVLWGCLVAVLNYVPFAGALVGSAVVFVVALVSLESLGAALMAPTIYGVLNMIESNFITPGLLGKTTELNPVMIMLSLVLWGAVWGLGGALLAVPLLLIAKIVCDELEPLKPIGVFLAA